MEKVCQGFLARWSSSSSRTARRRVLRGRVAPPCRRPGPFPPLPCEENTAPPRPCSSVTASPLPRCTQLVKSPRPEHADAGRSLSPLHPGKRSTAQPLPFLARTLQTCQLEPEPLGAPRPPCTTSAGYKNPPPEPSRSPLSARSRLLSLTPHLSLPLPEGRERHCRPSAARPSSAVDAVPRLRTTTAVHCPAPFSLLSALFLLPGTHRPSLFSLLSTGMHVAPRRRRARDRSSRRVHRRHPGRSRASPSTPSTPPRSPHSPPPSTASAEALGEPCSATTVAGHGSTAISWSSTMDSSWAVGSRSNGAIPIRFFCLNLEH